MHRRIHKDMAQYQFAPGAGRDRKAFKNQAENNDKNGKHSHIDPVAAIPVADAQEGLANITGVPDPAVNKRLQQNEEKAGKKSKKPFLVISSCSCFLDAILHCIFTLSARVGAIILRLYEPVYIYVQF